MLFYLLFPRIKLYVVANSCGCYIFNEMHIIAYFKCLKYKMRIIYGRYILVMLIDKKIIKYYTSKNYPSIQFTTPRYYIFYL